MWHIVNVCVLLAGVCIARTVSVGLHGPHLPYLQQQQDIEAQQRLLTREVQLCESRQTPGPICESCELLATCVRQANGWVNIPVETCDTMNGFYCNSRLGMCSNVTGPCHPFGIEGNFPCTSHGVFPDPYDCQKYHVCYFVDSSMVSATLDCGGDKAFNAGTGQCSLTLADAVCQHKQYECQNAGDAHAWPNNANIFYVCKATSNQEERVLYPSLYRCGDAEIFDGYYCRPSSGHMTTAAPAPVPTLSPGTASTSNAPGSTPSPAGTRCDRVGLYPDPQNCHAYYYCSVMNGVQKHMQCPDGAYYNANLSACALGNCPQNL